ncbi:fibronectin type III domain-containing protein, partial [Limisphaera sp. 4302-co]|uniref:fibronectin type III domain-containing protein n=1 Tax=Limisphaera sp. 4302-co TaxID=3400417 RepID=UPI003C1FE9D4
MLHQLRRLLSLPALLVGLAQVPNVLDAAEVALAWDPSPDEWVTGYAIHYGTASGVHPVRVDVGNVTNAVIDGLQPGVTYYFVATAYTADGLESDPSNEVSYTVPNPQPDPTNAPPSVNAGPDQTVRLPSLLALTGQVNDDGLPSEPGQLTVWWELVSGPAGVNWSTTNGLSVEVAFAEPG